MDKTDLIQRRKGRYMAQLLDDFEARVAPHLPPEVTEEFKGVIRQKMSALSIDAAEIAELREHPNAVLEEMRTWMEHHRPQSIPSEELTTT